MADAKLDNDNLEPGHFFHGLPSFSFEEFLDRVLDKLYSDNRRITKDLRGVLKNGTFFDIFEALWNFDEEHHVLELPEKLLPDNVVSEKSVEQSLEYLRLGHLRRHVNKDAALQRYNRCIIFAPHPPIRIGDKLFGATPEGIDEKHAGPDKEGWGYYPSLARGCKARADLLFEMHQYQACIQDTVFVQRLGCPQEVNSYLEDMRAHCYQMISKPENAGFETFASFSDTNAEPPVLQDPNPHIPAASSAVSLTYDKKGLKRHLKTNRDVKQGEVLIVEKNFCSTLLPKYIRLFCITCMKRTWTPLPCSSCTQVVFCSSTCRAEALVGFHGQECSILTRLNAINIEVRGILACRILFKTTFKKLEKEYEVIMKERKKSLKTRGLTQDGIFRSDDYLSVYSMVGKRKHTSVDKLARAIEAFVLLKLLIASNSFFVTPEGRWREPSWEDQLFTGSLLLHHLTHLWHTADAFFETEVIEADCTRNPMKAIGAGVFPVTNLAMVAGCYAPCASFTHGGHLVTRATCAISAGTVLTCKYTDHIWRLLPSKDDEIFAQDVFGSCMDAVTYGVGDLVKESFFLKCVRCHGKVQSKCFNCGLEYSTIGPVPDIPNLSTYNPEEVLQVANTLLSRYESTRIEVRRRRVYTGNDLDNIREMIAYFDKYVYLPCTMHRDAQLMYIIIMNHMTSAVLHDGKTAPGCTIC